MTDITSSAVITCITGLPRQGKTLWTVNQINELAKKLGLDQTIYVHGIPELRIEGCASLVDPKLWWDLPMGSIIFIDEAWQHFPQRHSSAKVPEHVEATSMLGHRGLQLYLITQNGSDLDGFVRGRVGRHIHVERIIGSEMATVFEWPELKNPKTKGERKVADVKTWAYPKHVYKLYRSSQLHTVKTKIPAKLKWAAAGVVMAIVMAIGGVLYFKSHMGVIVGKQAEQKTDSAAPSKNDAAPPAGPAMAPQTTSTAAAKPNWFDERVPRLAGLPHTAPVYDSLTSPTVAPKPVACVKMRGRCDCYTQQGTKLPGVPKDVCEGIVENGFFDDSPERVQANGPVAAPVATAAPVQPQPSGKITLSQVTASMPAAPAPNLSVAQP